MRFNALRREIGEISQKMLSTTLRNLERDGFVTRSVTPTTPPQVEYALTDLGASLLEPVRALAVWTLANAEKIEAARRAYGARADGSARTALLRSARRHDLSGACPSPPKSRPIRSRRRSPRPPAPWPASAS